MRGNDAGAGSLFSYVGLEKRVRADPGIVADLQVRLVTYAGEQKPSEWITAQP